MRQGERRQPAGERRRCKPYWSFSFGQRDCCFWRRASCLGIPDEIWVSKVRLLAVISAMCFQLTGLTSRDWPESSDDLSLHSSHRQEPEYSYHNICSNQPWLSLTQSKRQVLSKTYDDC
ncbi:hypothetical protein STEG23_020780 [Scotinomys teguina]